MLLKGIFPLYSHSSKDLKVLLFIMGRKATRGDRKKGGPLKEDILLLLVHELF
jgi:hypothetical protein